jgi:hypothetical protein
MMRARSFGKYKVASEPEALLAVLKNLAYHFKRIGLEPGPGAGRRRCGAAHAAIPRPPYRNVR